MSSRSRNDVSTSSWGELRLSIRAQVFVPEAADDLIVAFEPRHHQKLFEDLRRLRQREESAGVRAARDEVVASALRRSSREHWSLDVDETLRVEKFPYRAGDAGPGLDPREHFGAAQIDISISEPRLFTDVDFVELKRRSSRLIQDLQGRSENLDRAGRHLGVDRPWRPFTHPADRAQNVLRAHPFGCRERLDGVGVVHDLHQTGAIAQVDEDHATVVATPVHPATERDGLANEVFGDGAAEMRTHRIAADDETKRGMVRIGVAHDNCV